MQRLCDNALTELGTSQFFEHTTLMTVRVREAIGTGARPCAGIQEPVSAGAGPHDRVAAGGGGAGGRRGASWRASSPTAICGATCSATARGSSSQPLARRSATRAKPLTISADALLYEAANLFKQHKVDNVVVVEADRPVGLLDVQDLVRMGLLG